MIHTDADGSPVVFLDKDGTLIRNISYNVDPDKIQLTAGARTGLKRLHEDGFRIALASNQDGVAFGYFPESALRAVKARIEDVLAEFDVPLAGFYYCPHHPDAVLPDYRMRCSCRKPEPGLIASALKELKANSRNCWMVGDILDDIEAGRRAGCRTVLLDNGGETEWNVTQQRQPDYIVNDLAEAAEIISAHDKRFSSVRSRAEDDGWAIH